ncbi:MAG: hypothetical protein M1368_12440 [Thaumarchaeota archaeon]|nr:hypothetical protein [Nitrososphaerota archaeon]MDG6908248.1 hypothetical protein [Nitrososphaerota archaeon]
MWSTRRIVALVVFIIPWVFWLTAISHAISFGFVEDKYGVQTMVLGGAISMVAGSIAALWE